MSFYQSIVKLYDYKQEIQLMYVDSQIKSTKLDNRPMNNRLIKIHKGVDNQIRVKVTNPDRKLVAVDYLELRASFVSTENKERVIEKYLKHSSEKGILQLELLEGELSDVPPGFYHMYISGEERLITGAITSDVVAHPFYTNLMGDIIIPVEVVASAESQPFPTYDITSFIPALNTTNEIIHYTSAVPGNRVKNQLNALHTFSVTATNYTGELVVLGTLENTPIADGERDYFTVKLLDDSTVITFSEFTGTQYFNFEHNCMWIKFRKTDDNANEGTIDKISFRS